MCPYSSPLLVVYILYWPVSSVESLFSSSGEYPLEPYIHTPLHTHPPPPAFFDVGSSCWSATKQQCEVGQGHRTSLSFCFLIYKTRELDKLNSEVPFCVGSLTFSTNPHPCLHLPLYLPLSSSYLPIPNTHLPASVLSAFGKRFQVDFAGASRCLRARPSTLPLPYK